MTEAGNKLIRAAKEARAMGQWKLVPMKPTRAMLVAAHMIERDGVELTEDEHRAMYEAFLSAAPSPDPSEDEVEAVARALCVDDGVDPDAVGYDRTGRDLPNWYVVQGTARAAIAAMRPRRHCSHAPTLSPEDNTRVEEIRKRIVAIRDAMLNRRGPTFGDLANAEQALSLIDKLAGEG